MGLFVTNTEEVESFLAADGDGFAGGSLMSAAATVVAERSVER